MLDFLGHLFGWDDIKNTSDDIYSLLVGSVDWVSDGITKVEPKIERLVRIIFWRKQTITLWQFIRRPQG